MAENVFNPGNGWREGHGYLDDKIAEKIIYRDGEGNSHFWIRDVPPVTLPTAPYTVIKVTWLTNSDEDANETNRILMCFPEDWYGEWGWSENDDFGSADTLARSISEYEVLSEPRGAHKVSDTDEGYRTGYKAGVKDALDRVRAQSDRYRPRGNILGAADTAEKELGLNL